MSNRWGTVIAGIIILMCLGVAYAWGIFLVPIDNEMDWGRGKISFAVSVLLLIFSIFMAVGGILEKKIGAPNTATIGGTLVGLGWILAAFSRSPVNLYLSYGILGGIGTGLSYMPSISTGIKCFPQQKGLITGLIVFGFGFGTAFLSPFLTHFIKLYQWRTTMLFCGLSFGLLIISASRFLKIPEHLTDTSNDFKQTNREVSFSPLEMLKSKMFTVMVMTYFMAMVAGMMVIGHLNAFTVDKHFTAMQGAFALTILSVFNGVGRILFGYVSDVFGGKKALVVLFSVIGLMTISLYHAIYLPLIYLFSAIIGLCFGGFLAVYPPLTADYFGHKYFSINYGLIFIGYGSGCFAGPLLGGVVHDMTNNYLMAFYTAGGLALIGGVFVSLFLKRPHVKTIADALSYNNMDVTEKRH